MSSAPPALPAEPRKIAVLRANAIGDFVFALPALEALRARFPAAEIVLLGLPWHAEFLGTRPSPVDRVIPLPRIRGVGAPEDFDTNPEALAECLAQLRAEQFDLAVQLHGGGQHSNPFLRSIGAKSTIGMRAAGAEPLDHWVPYVYWQSEVLRLLEVVALAGAAPVTLAARLSVTDADLEEARAACGGTPERLVIVHPGAGDPRRRWPIEHFATVGKALHEAGFELAVVGSGADQPLADELCARLGAGAANLAGRLSLGGLAGLGAQCRLFVGNDSGPLHVAEAAGAPTVGIYWCGNIVNADPITRANHRPVLSWQLTCPACGANVMESRCEHEVSFADLAPVEEALGQAFDLLGVSREQRAGAG